MTKAKPTALKKVEGTYRKDRDKAPELRPSVEISLNAPSDLNEWGQKIWEEVMTEYGPVGLITRVDLGSFYTLCSWYGVFREAEDLVRAKGLEVEEEIYSAKGELVGTKTVTNPMIAVMDKAQKNYTAMAKEFGITPSSRFGLSMPSKPQDDGFGEFK
jgi:P27 family predicted phage terminase small subunit